MLAVSPLRSSQYGGNDRDGNADAFSSMLQDFSDSTFLEDINFDDICAGFDLDGDALPDLEVDPADIFAEFGVAEEEEEEGASAAETAPAPEAVPGVDVGGGARDIVAPEVNMDPSHPEETLLPATKEEHSTAAASSEAASSSSGSGGGGKPSASAAGGVKNSQGKKKVKVDWTPELHRRFVQAVEMLGVEKAVPSRILELMGIECLTRHNIASHLQKYRSHRKHAIAREAEAASCWPQRLPQTYPPPGAGAKTDAYGAAPWLAPPTIGFPPPPLPAPPVQPFRSLHVWGHPTGDLQPLVRPWPRHILLAGPQGPPAAAPPQWASPHLPGPPAPPEASSYWHHYQYSQRGAREGWIPHAMTRGTPCFRHPMPTARFAAAAVPAPAAGILPHPLVLRRTAAPSKQANSQLHLDAHPTKESVDAAIEDALRKPWSPLPLGLTPPSVDSVLVELQRQGVAKVPPSCTTS